MKEYLHYSTCLVTLECPVSGFLEIYYGSSYIAFKSNRGCVVSFLSHSFKRHVHLKGAPGPKAHAAFLESHAALFPIEHAYLV